MGPLESRSERERQKERRSGWRRERIGAQRTSSLRQSGCLGIAKASFANTGAGRTRFRAEEGKEEEMESRSLRGKFEIQKRREQNDENDLPALLSRLERSLVSRAVHLRSTNLSIVSRQISGNITDMFRHEPSSLSPFLLQFLIRCSVVSSRSIVVDLSYRLRQLLLDSATSSEIFEGDSDGFSTIV